MMDGLDKPFAARVTEILAALRKERIEMRVVAGLRTPREQARLWRQSRSREEIAGAICHLEKAGAWYLAGVLRDCGPCQGPPVTRALPGLSWHQWGEAVDCAWIVDGVAEWSTTRLVDRMNGYHAWARMAEDRGLTAGGLWSRMADWPHVQKRKEPSPLAAGLSLKTIDEAMQARFDMRR